MNTHLQFHSNGTIHCLWTDAVPLHSLGKLSIRRAATIEFNHATQHWEVKQSKHIRFFARSRQTCLDWERQYFNR